MQYQALFYQKNDEKYSRLLPATVMIGTLRVNHCYLILGQNTSKEDRLGSGAGLGIVQLKVFCFIHSV